MVEFEQKRQEDIAKRRKELEQKIQKLILIQVEEIMLILGEE